MTHAHHDAAGHDERRGGEAELLAAEQRGDDDVTPRLELAVDLDDDPVAQTVDEERLLGLGQAELPRAARVLERGQRRRSGAAVVARDEDDVGVRLGHARRDRPHALLGHELDVDPRLRVGVLQVVDELSQVLDRIDVVVGRGRDESDARRRAADLGHPRVDLARRELPALTRLGALRHLDLDVGAVGQVVAGHAEPAGGHLLDGGATPVPVRVGVEAVDSLPALAGVGARLQAVHRDRQRLVRLGRDGAVAHRASGEPLDDLGDRLDFLDRHGRAVALDLEQPAQRRQPLRLVVDQAGVLLEDLVAARARGVLELEHRVRVEQVVLALPAPLVLAADLELAVRGLLGPRQEREAVPEGHVLGDLVQANAVDRADGAGEVLVAQLLRQAGDVEQLGTGVGGEGGDAHLGHHLEHALGGGLPVVVAGLGGVYPDEVAVLDQLVDRLERHVRVDRVGAVPEQHGHVVDLAGVTGLDHQADAGAGLLAHQVVVHR